MTITLNVRDIVRLQLVADGFDGLVASGGECACLLGDLAPCGDMKHDCIAGHSHVCGAPDCEWECDGEGDFHVIPGMRPQEKKQP